jgi:hypothetical protein
MTVTRSVAADLTCNGTTPAGAVRAIQARLELGANSALVVSYLLIADMHRLRIPHRAPPRRVDGLWRHTCFEVFLGVPGSPAYCEFNFSPSGEWAAYRFRGYRDGDPLPDEALAPDIASEFDDARLTLSAQVRWDRLALIDAGSSLRVGLSAVIEAADSGLSYWALKHPADKPDFHHADSFALEVALSAMSA